MRRRSVLAAAALLLVAGCGSDPASGPGEQPSPTEATTGFLVAVEDGDCEAVRDLVLTPSELDCSVVEGYRSLLDGEAAADVDVREVSVDGTSAVVEVDPGSGAELKLQRVDGTWLLVVDSAA